MLSDIIIHGLPLRIYNLIRILHNDILAFRRNETAGEPCGPSGCDFSHLYNDIAKFSNNIAHPAPFFPSSMASPVNGRALKRRDRASFGRKH